MGKELEVMLGVAVGVVACHNGTGLLGDICQAHHLKHLLLVTACLKEAQAKIPKDPKMQWMKKMKNDSLQCLNELAYVLERSGRYDHRGYRASIRKQLRRYLQRRNMPLPDWLEDKGARFIVMQFRDASFDYIQSIKEQERKRRQPPVPEDPSPNASKVEQRRKCAYIGGFGCTSEVAGAFVDRTKLAEKHFDFRIPHQLACQKLARLMAKAYTYMESNQLQKLPQACQKVAEQYRQLEAEAEKGDDFNSWRVMTKMHLVAPARMR